MSLKEFDITPVDSGLKGNLQRKIDSKTKPIGSLGRLEEIALKIGLIQQTLTPSLSQPILAVFAGDHGIAKEGVVNAYPQEVTAQMVQNMAQGGAAVNVFCRTHKITPKVIDAGVVSKLSSLDGIIDKKIGGGTSNYATRPAMSREQCREAINKGVDLIDEWHENGSNVIGFGEMGIGNTSSASIITCLIIGESIEGCTGKGTGLDEDGIAAKTEVLKKAIKHHNIKGNPLSTLETFGGFEIAMIIGGILQAAENRMIILIDGFIVTAALLIAYRLYPSVLDYVIFSHESGERGHQIQLDYLGAKPILNLDMRLGEGTGAAMVFPVIKSAVNFLNEMTSFEDAGVSRGDK